MTMTRVEWDREHAKLAKERAQWLKFLKREGLTLDEIAEHTGWSRRLVASVVRQP